MIEMNSNLQKEHALIPNLENVIPMVVEGGPRGERQFDIYSLLLRERVIFLGTPVYDQMANAIIAQLLYLDREDHERPINLYINSPGGMVTAGLAIYDTMRLVSAPISTICVGMAASFAAVLLCAGTPGMRHALPNSTILLHQVAISGGVQGQASDIEIQARHTIRIEDKMRQIISMHTGQPYDKVARDTDRDYYLTAEEAVDYGLIDNVMAPNSENTDNA